MRPDELPIDPDLAPDDPGEPRIHRRRVRSRPRRATPDVVATIACGGALGTLARAGLGRMFPVAPGHFPGTTLAINLVGSFVLGVVLVVLLDAVGPTPRLRPFLTTGVLGGFTTFSTFTVESARLVGHDRPVEAVVSIAVSVIGGVSAAWAGTAAARRAVTPAAGTIAETEDPV